MSRFYSKVDVRSMFEISSRTNKKAFCCNNFETKIVPNTKHLFFLCVFLIKVRAGSCDESVRLRILESTGLSFTLSRATLQLRAATRGGKGAAPP